jgi:hypothetical protein
MREDIAHIVEECNIRGWYITGTTKIDVSWWDEDRDFSEETLQVLSYGGGTQSTAMLIMMKEGLIPKVDVVIHADTGSELPETVAFIETAKEYVENVLKIPFVIVNSHRGTLHDDYMRHSNIPIIGTRSCTGNFKILPQRRFIRMIVGKRNKLLAECQLGITTDESRRRTEGDVQWCGLKYPLLDVYPTTRDECIDLNSKHGWKVAKSGCFCCPYQGGKQWLELKNNYPDLFQIAVEMENKKMRVKGGRLGLYQERRLSDLDNITLEESQCGSGAGCFI